MHKLAETPITKDCFELDDEAMSLEINKEDQSELPIELKEKGYIDHWNLGELWELIIQRCEELRQSYNATQDVKYWKELIRLLPDSWLQTRTVTLNYENLLAMCSKGQRRFHKLTEWRENFIAWARTLPYAQELIFIDESNP